MKNLEKLGLGFAGVMLVIWGVKVTGGMENVSNDQPHASTSISPSSSPSPSPSPSAYPIPSEMTGFIDPTTIPAPIDTTTQPPPTKSTTKKPTQKPTTKPPPPKPTTKPPAPKPTTKPAPKPTTKKPVANYYKNCDDVRAHGAAPLYAGQPGYRAGLDRDHDGIACEG